MKDYNQRGFSLVELMMAVTIVGVMATVAIPSYRRFICNTKEGEVKTTLSAIVVAQIAYRTEHDSYAQDSPLGCACPGCADCTFSEGIMAGLVRGKQRYNFTCTQANPGGFTVIADAQASTSDLSGSVWSVNHMKTMEIVTPADGCY